MFETFMMETVENLVELWHKLLEVKKQEELEASEWESLQKAYVKHLKWRFDYPTKVFNQQIIVSWLMTILVFLLVTCGLVFSFIQLYWALQLGSLSDLETEIAIQTAGELSFRSSLVGATVLIISLIFFHLYLRHVFGVKFPIPPHVSLKETDVSQIRKQSVTEEQVKPLKVKNEP